MREIRKGMKENIVEGEERKKEVGREKIEKNEEIELKSIDGEIISSGRDMEEKEMMDEDIRIKSLGMMDEGRGKKMKGEDNEKERKRRIVNEWKVGRIDMMEGGVDLINGIRKGKKCMKKGKRNGERELLLRRELGMENENERSNEVKIERKDENIS